MCICRSTETDFSKTNCKTGDFMRPTIKFLLLAMLAGGTLGTARADITIGGEKIKVIILDDASDATQSSKNAL